MSTSIRSQVLGTFLGGAVGDALGEPLEFTRIEEIHRTYGPEGLTGYARATGPNVFSNDAQMTLWTAEGLIRARQRQSQSEIWTRSTPSTTPICVGS